MFQLSISKFELISFFLDRDRQSAAGSFPCSRSAPSAPAAIGFWSPPPPPRSTPLAPSFSSTWPHIVPPFIFFSAMHLKHNGCRCCCRPLFSPCSFPLTKTSCKAPHVTLGMAVWVRVLHPTGAGLGAFLHPWPESDPCRTGFGCGFHFYPRVHPKPEKPTTTQPFRPSPANLAPGSPTTNIRHSALGLPTSPNPSPHRSRLPTRFGQWLPPPPSSSLPRPRGGHWLASFSASQSSLSSAVQCRSL
jgi:hypothetical protein